MESFFKSRGPRGKKKKKLTFTPKPRKKYQSTVLRSVAACSLLASCGLRAPCSQASVPALDAIVLRAFAADAPSSGRSSFAVEMDETRHVLAAASSSSKSLILGKSSEERKKERKTES